MKIFALLLCISLVACTSTKPKAPESDTSGSSGLFEGMNGCFLLYNMKKNKIRKVIGDENCKRQLTACSTFKVPLLLMALDSKVVLSEFDDFKWDGRQYAIQSWNQDQTTESWLKNSVVWVSQQITPKLGLEKIKKYLKKFKYGNEDMSGGITEAWLTSTGEGSLKISAHEQLEFLKKLWKKKLPVSQPSIALTKKLMPLELSYQGFELHGKTGSGFTDPEKHFRIGWFMGHLERGDDEYLVVTSFTDQVPQFNDEWGGLTAKSITKELLAKLDLW